MAAPKIKPASGSNAYVNANESVPLPATSGYIEDDDGEYFPITEQSPLTTSSASSISYVNQPPQRSTASHGGYRSGFSEMIASPPSLSIVDSAAVTQSKSAEDEGMFLH